MRTASCDICLGSDLAHHPASERAGRSLVVCRGCGLVSASSPPEVLARPSAVRRDPGGDAHRSSCVRRLLPRGRILEVGCDEGAFLAGLRPGHHEVVGVADTSGAASEAKRRLGESRIVGEIVTGELTDLGLPAESFDLVAMFGSLGRHLSPRAVLMESVRLLRTAGFIVIETPDVASWAARLRGSRWSPWHDPASYYFFNLTSLERLTATCGFLPERGIHGYHHSWRAFGTLSYTGRKSSETIKASSFTDVVEESANGTPIGAT